MAISKSNGNQTENQGPDGRLAPGNKLGNRFKKGESGNPLGRPRGTRNVTTVLREMLERIAPGEIAETKLMKEFCKPTKPKSMTNADAVAARILKAAIIDGEPWAVRELLDRTEGRAAVSVRMGDENGEPLKITFDFHSQAQLTNGND